MQGEVEVEQTEGEEEEGEEEHAASPRNVGHNIYILAHQVKTQEHLQSQAFNMIHDMHNKLPNANIKHRKRLCTKEFVQKTHLYNFTYSFLHTDGLK